MSNKIDLRGKLFVETNGSTIAGWRSARTDGERTGQAVARSQAQATGYSLINWGDGRVTIYAKDANGVMQRILCSATSS